MKLTLESGLAAVQSYLAGDVPYPLFVAVENGFVMEKVLQSLGDGFQSIRVSAYCPSECPDNFPDEDGVTKDILTAKSNLIVRGLGEYAMLSSRYHAIRCLYGKALSHKTIVVGRGLSDELTQFRAQETKLNAISWLSINSEPDVSIIKVHPSVPFPAFQNFRELLEAMELGRAGKLYAHTDLKLFHSGAIESSYEAIREQNRFFSVAENALIPEQWTDYLRDNRLTGNDLFHWRTFLQQAIYGAKTPYLRLVMEFSPDYETYQKSLYSAILKRRYSDDDFRALYEERKTLLKPYSDKDVTQYIAESYVANGERIHYLTDNTRAERRAIVEELARIKAIPDDLPYIYPDLAAYFDAYRFETDDGELFTHYIERYKMQKAFNKIEPEFLRDVEELSKPGNRKYLSLPTRGMVLTQLSKSGVGLYWLDALGVEYLGYIRKKAKELGLSVHIHIVRTSLPTITRLPSKGQYSEEERKHNGGFYDDWTGYKRLRNSALDNVKHDGVIYGAKSDAPAVYLADELEIIAEALKTIKSDLENHLAQKMLLASDHGASRLCVLRQHENKWKMSEKGKYSGRCCPANDTDEPPESATREHGFWVLANYDRFQGGRPAIVEAHGGASLEEVMIPLIELELADNRVQCYVAGFEGKEQVVIEKPLDGKPTLLLYCYNATVRLRVRIKDREYFGVQDTENRNLFRFSLDGHWSMGKIYTAIVYHGDNELTAIPFVFSRTRKPMTKNGDGMEFFQ